MVNLPIKLEIPEEFYKEEERCDYVVSTEMKKIWAVELDLLAEFDRVCKENNLKYYADGGTMLGAIRHKGFIPWDDDIDVIMFREDYNRLCEIAEKAFKEPYFLQTEYSDPGSFRGHAQLRNSKTTAILRHEEEFKFSFNQGIFIDIFPLDEIPDEEGERALFLQQISAKREQVKKAVRYGARYNQDKNKIKRMIKTFMHLFNGITKEIQRFSEFEKLESSYNNNTHKCVAKLFFPEVTKNFIWERKWFTEIEYCDFEMIKIPVSTQYDSIMTQFFGDWRTPIRQETTHNGILFDSEKSYLNYTTGGK